MPLEVGETRYYGAALAPANWLLLDGGLYDGAVYVDLFALLGGSYNVGGEPAGWFRVPDVRNRCLPGWAGGGIPTNDGVAEGLRVPGTHTMPGGVTGTTDPWPGGVAHLIGGLPGAASTSVANCLAGVGAVAVPVNHGHNIAPPDLNDHVGAGHYHNHDDSAAAGNWPPRLGLNVIIYAGV